MNAPYPDWIYNQSAVLPYRRRDDGEVEVLLITSRSGKRWVVPKGIVDPGLGPGESALKEAGEEAGVTGRVGETPLGRYRQDKWGGTCVVEVFPLEVERERSDWPEAGTRRRRWFSQRDAARKVGRKRLRRIIERFEGAAGRAPVPAPRRPRARLVYLLRHAKSSWSDAGLSDEQRPLAARGERACEAMSRYLALADVRPDLVVCSSALRTRQTLAGVTLGEGTPIHYLRELYGAAPAVMLERLRRSPINAASVMLIGHSPGIEDLAMRLASSGDEAARRRLATKFPTGALATLVFRGGEWTALDDGTCELHSFVCPREIGEEPPDRARSV